VTFISPSKTRFRSSRFVASLRSQEHKALLNFRSL
jgi:hypothetical protein